MPRDYVKAVTEGGFTVTFSNRGRAPKPHAVKRGRFYEKDWVGELTGLGVLPHYHIIDSLLQWASQDEGRLRLLDNFVREVEESFRGHVPDSDTLQSLWDGRRPRGLLDSRQADFNTPDEIWERVVSLIDDNFPKKEFGGEMAGDKPLRIVAYLLALAFACEEINRGDAWYRDMYLTPIGRRYGGPRKGGCLMPMGYYLLRRHTAAAPRHVEMLYRQRR